jgi:hypothetical protein
VAVRTCPHCHSAADALFFRCPACTLPSHLTILFTGPVLSMKSMTASYLHRVLKIGIVESAYYGGVGSATKTDQERRKERRQRVIDAAMVFARSNLPVIVDAAYHRRTDRLEFVRRHREQSGSNVNELICVCCYSADLERRKYRLQDRNESPEPLEVEPQSMEDAQALLVQYEVPNAEEPYPVVYFNTDKFTVQLLNHFRCARHVNEFLEKIKEHIERAVAIGRL